MELPEIQQHEIAEIEDFAAKRDSMLGEIRKVIVGQDHVIEEVLIGLFAKGHCLLVGVPGLAKTLLISTLAEILDLEFNRIQFTPDLMPSDITGTDILQEDAGTGKRSFQFLRGPIFTNILLADEINRTPPKTQAALLQSMQEYKVTAGGSTFALSLPFFVLATQNPIEQEGTYPLPEAQLDRFMVNIEIDYPNFEDEVQIHRQFLRTLNQPDVQPDETLRELARRTYQAWVTGPFASRDGRTIYVPGFNRAAQEFDSEFGFSIEDIPFDEAWSPPKHYTGDEPIDVDSLPKLPNLPRTVVKAEPVPEPATPCPPPATVVSTEQPNTISYSWVHPGASRYLNNRWAHLYGEIK